MNRKILITGAKGYLASNIIKSIVFKDFEFIEFEGDVREIANWDRYKDDTFKYIFHAGSPAANLDNYDNNYIIDSIIKGTRNAISLSNHSGSPLINFSTKGIFITTSKNLYEESKKQAFIEVINSCNSYCNLIIPRIYSKDRQKGLIPKLRDGLIPDSELDKRLQYLDLAKFLLQLRVNLSNKIVHFKNIKENTIREIKTIYT